jgi:hypothetical protein
MVVRYIHSCGGAFIAIITIKNKNVLYLRNKPTGTPAPIVANEKLLNLDPIDHTSSAYNWRRAKHYQTSTYPSHLADEE